MALPSFERRDVGYAGQPNNLRVKEAPHGFIEYPDVALPAGTFFDDLDPRMPRKPVEEFEEQIDLSPLEFFLRQINDACVPVGKNPVSRSNDIAKKTDIFIPNKPAKPVGMDQDLEAIDESAIVEAGRVMYMDGGRLRLSQLVRSHGINFPEIVQETYNLVDRGKYPLGLIHGHPFPLQKFPTLDDWIPLLQQRKMGQSVPLASVSMTLSSELQILAIMTAESHRVLPDWDLERFRNRWVDRFVRGNPVNSSFDITQIIFPGDCITETPDYGEASVQQTQDAITAALLEELKPVMYCSTDWRHFFRKDPLELLREVNNPSGKKEHVISTS